MVWAVLSTNLFAKAFGFGEGATAYSIVQTSDGGYAVAGEAGGNALVLKISSDGSLEWAKTFGEGCAYSIVQTSDGGFAVTGGSRDVLILKLSPDGSLEWAKAFGGDEYEWGYSIVQTSDGGYAVAGWTNSFGAGDWDVLVLKVSPDGSLEWAKTFGFMGDTTDRALSIAQASDGSYVVAGESYTLGDYEKALVLKLSSDGSLEWARAFGGTWFDDACSVVLTSEGSFVVAGKTSSFGAGGWDFFALKFSSGGSLEWAKTFGGTHDDYVHSIIRTSDGGFAAVGETEGFGVGYRGILVIKFSSDGSIEWAKTFEGDLSNEAHSIIQTADGGFVVAGETEGRVVVFTLNPDGSYGGCVSDVTPTEQSVSPTVTSPSLSTSSPSLSVSSPSIPVSAVSPSVEDVCPPGALCESSPSPRLAYSPFPGGVLFLSPRETEIKIYTVDGKLARSLKLRKGKNRVYLKPGVYLWQAGGQGGKAVVR